MKDEIRGRVWVVRSEEGLIADIDTDQIFHNAHLHITEVGRMGAFAFGNLRGWEDFPSKAGVGDIVAAGRNFGAGSSRQQAVDCFRALGVGAILAPSFGAIYFRNAVNSAFPVLRAHGLAGLVLSGGLETGDEILLDVRSGRGRNLVRNLAFELEPMSGVQLDIRRAGGLLDCGRRIPNEVKAED